MENRSETAPPGKPRSEATIAFALLLLLTMVAASPLLGTGWYISHEFSSPLQRVYALAHEIRAGTLYPRWLSLTAFNFGTPFFNFYSPGFYLVTAYLYVLGIPLLYSIKLISAILLFVGAAGMYLWARRHYSERGALTAAVLYLFAPYHFLNLYVRGAMSEYSALAFLPFLFLGIDLVFDEKARARGTTVIAFSSSAIVLSHNLSAMMAAPFAIIYFATLVCFSGWNKKACTRGVAGVAAGAGLSAFYWLPLILEVRHLHNLRVILTSDYSNYRNHFVYLWQLVSTYWGYGASMPGPEDEMGFQIGIVTLIFCFASIAALLVKTESPKRYPLLVMSLGFMGLFMTNGASDPIYRVFSPLAYLQFPWRFLGPTSLFLAALGGFAGEAMVFKRLGGRTGPWIPVISATVLCVGLSAPYLQIWPAPQAEWYNSTEQLNRYFLGGPEMSYLCNDAEYLPQWVPRIGEKELKKLAFDYPRGEGINATDVGWPTPGMTFSTTADSAAADVELPIFYFPGWEVRIDGQPVAVRASAEGRLSFDLSSGQHRVEAYFGTTPPRIFGWALTFATVILGGGLWALIKSGAGTNQ